MVEVPGALLLILLTKNTCLAYVVNTRTSYNDLNDEDEEHRLNSLKTSEDKYPKYWNGYSEEYPDDPNYDSSFPEIDARGFHELVFDGLRDNNPIWRKKRMPFGISARGFHDDVFDQDFGNFHTVKKRSTGEFSPLNRDASPTKEENRFYKTAAIREKPHGGLVKSISSARKPQYDKRISRKGEDMFTEGFGDFSTMKRMYDILRDRRAMVFHGDTFNDGFGEFDTMKKRRYQNGFHGDTFNDGFGEFDTMKKRRYQNGFHGDTFNDGFGEFDTMKKRRYQNGFHGDTFTHGFGDFETMKRRPGGMFHGDTFHQGFGDFETMKRRPGNEFFGDTFHQGFGDFDTMKRRPGNEFFGDTFHQGFGDFDTMKRRSGSLGSDNVETAKRRPNDGFHGDTFHQGFGDFETMRKKKSTEKNQ